tara:strand:+ start:385 stop:936 length:552 start_codon:yes stop_codon:yes gene_type:complete
MWKLGDKVIREGKAWVDANGVTHPQTWARWTDEEKKAVGLTFVADPKPWDNRFYWGWDAKEENLIERSLDDKNEVDSEGKAILDENGKQVVTLGLKSVAIARTKAEARNRLSQTDWYCTRAYETGGSSAIPTAVSNYRTAVRTKSKTIEDAISACDTHAKFMALYDVPDGGTVAPIADWPEEI